MVRLADLLGELDRIHFQRILGEREDPAHAQTRRRFRVKALAMDHTYVADEAQAALRTLSQDDRERLLSDLVWRLTCRVEGSPPSRRGRGTPLEGGFRLRERVREGRTEFVVEGPA